MRTLFYLFLFLPLCLPAQLKKANKLADKGQLEKALTAYETALATTDSITLVAANFGYHKTYARLHPEAAALPGILGRQREVEELINDLSPAKQKMLSKEWRLSLRTVLAQRRGLRKRAERSLRRSGFPAIFEQTRLAFHPTWPDSIKMQIYRYAVNRQGELLEAKINNIREQGLLAYRPWREEMKEHKWDLSLHGKMDALREQLVRQTANNPAVTYEELREIFNHHFSTETGRNPKMRSLISDQLYDRFIAAHGFEELHQFVADNPKHWVARDCYVAPLATILKNKERHRLPTFLKEYPNTILDKNVLFYIQANLASIRKHPETNKTALEQLEAELLLRHKIANQGDTSQVVLQELLDYCAATKPATRVYTLFRYTAQFYLKNRLWNHLDQLVAGGLNILDYGQPEDCDVPWMLYNDKQDWLKKVQAILATGDCIDKNATLAVASEPKVDEYSPVLSADGQQLYFSRFRGFGSSYDILMTRKDANGEWGPAKRLPQLSDKNANEIPLSVNAAGTEMLLFLDGRLAISQRSKSGWAVPQRLEGTIAERKWHGSATLSPDGQYLIFESSFTQSKQATVPNTDLFLARRVGPNAFDEVARLWSLNSLGREHSPYLSYDGRTLYFSTDQGEGLGGMDVFVARREGKGWNEWSEPQNFGKCVNSFYDDTDFRMALAASGRDGYLGVNVPGDNLSGDIVRTTLPPAIRPIPLKVITFPITLPDSLSAQDISKLRIKVTDGQADEYTGGSIVDGQVVILAPESDPEVKVAIINPPDGPAIIKPVAVPYDFTADKLTVPVAINSVDGLKEGRERIRLLQPYAIDQSDFAPTAETLAQLAEAKEFLEDPNLRIVIHAYADNIGTTDYNRDLCQERAEAVQAYFIEQGIAPERIGAVGHGSIDFIEGNETERGREINRRVELAFRVVEEVLPRGG